MKKTIIGIISAIAVLAAVFLIFFPGLPKYISYKTSNKYAFLKKPLTEYDTSGVTVPDDYVEVSDGNGVTIKIPPNFTRKDDSRYTAYTDSSKNTVIFMYMNSDPGFSAENELKKISTKSVRKFFKRRGLEVPASEYEFIRCCHALTLDDINIHSRSDMKIFDQMVKLKKELDSAVSEAYTLKCGESEGLIEFTGTVGEKYKYIITLYSGENYSEKHTIAIGHSNPDKIKMLIASIKTEK